MRGRPGANQWCIVAGTILLLAAGCAQYDWVTEYTEYKRAEEQAQVAGRDVFIFYKWWLDDESNRMLSREVLSDPEVVALFEDTTNILVEKDFGPLYEDYMEKYGVTMPPASVILKPSGTFHVKKGFTSKPQFMQYAQKALSDNSPGRPKESSNPDPTPVP
jgi:hypothetical protein